MRKSKKLFVVALFLLTSVASYSQTRCASSSIIVPSICAETSANVTLVGLTPNAIYAVDYEIRSAVYTASSLRASSAGQVTFNTIGLSDAYNGETLRIKIISSGSACRASSSLQRNLTVKSIARLLSVFQNNAACEGSRAVFTLTGLYPNTVNQIKYTTDNNATQTPISNIGADATGHATFAINDVQNEMNNRTLTITEVSVTSDLTNTCVNTAPSVSTTILVNAAPENKTVTNKTLNICPGAFISVDLQNSQPDVSYQLINDSSKVPVSLPKNGNGADIQLEALSTPSQSLTLGILATSLENCQAIMQDKVTAQVVSAPVGSDIDLMSRCSRMAMAYTLATPSAVSYNISLDAAGLVLANSSTDSSGSGKTSQELSDDNWINETGSLVTVLYTISPVSSMGCVGNPFKARMPVNSAPKLKNTAMPIPVSSTICSGSSLGEAIGHLQDYYYNLMQFSWKVRSNVSDITGETLTTTRTDLITDVLVRSGTRRSVTVIYDIMAVTTEAGCYSGASSLITSRVIVNRKASVSAESNINVCRGSTQSIQLNGVVSYPTNGFFWSSSAGGTFSRNNIARPILTIPASSSEPSVRVKLTSSDPDGAGPCTPEESEMVITVNDLPVVILSASIGQQGSTSLQVQKTDPVFFVQGNYSDGVMTINPADPQGAAYPVLFVETKTPTALIRGRFTPANANSQQPYRIDYEYTNSLGCANSASLSVDVRDVTSVSFALEGAVMDNAVFVSCVNQKRIRLVGFPDASTGNIGTEFTLQSSSTVNPIVKQGDQYYFDTDIAPVGRYEVQYEYVYATGVIRSYTQYIELRQAPVAAFGKPSALCPGVPIQFSGVPTTLPGRTIRDWIWDFGDPSIGNETSSNPRITYPANGRYNITLTVMDNLNCTNLFRSSIQIDPIVPVNFAYSGQCAGDNNPIDFNANIDARYYAWDFGDGTLLEVENVRGDDLIPKTFDGGKTTGIYRAPVHQYRNAREYSVVLSAGSSKNCKSPETKKDLQLLTLKKVTDAYVENFDATNGDWLYESENTPLPNAGSNLVTWEWSTPPASNQYIKASDRNSMWWSSLRSTVQQNTYASNQRVIINSPCFDLSDLKNPMLSLDICSDLDAGYDGAVLQYSLDKGRTWRVLGTPGSGINWYNRNGISSNPGNQTIFTYGWSSLATPDQNWLTASYALDEINANNSGIVRFRVAFASDNNNGPTAINAEGFAFDNFFIGEKKRNVLVEHFTNLDDQSAVDDSDNLENFLYVDIIQPTLKKKYNSVSELKYCTSSDKIRRTSPTDYSARKLYYNVGNPPSTVANGLEVYRRLNELTSGNQNALDDLRKVLQKKSLFYPPFLISLKEITTGDPTKVSLQADIKSDTLITQPTPFIVQIALVEKTTPIGNNRVIHNTVKKLLLGSDGYTLYQTFAQGDIKKISTGTIVIDVPLSSGYGNNLYYVAFIQNKLTREINQVVELPLLTPKEQAITTAIEEDTSQEMVAVYPNPADASMICKQDFRDKPCSWKIYNQAGQLVMTGSLKTGENMISTKLLDSGLYIIIFTQENTGKIERHKIAIIH